MKETQQQVQSIQNILVGENVLVFLFDCSWQLWGGETAHGAAWPGARPPCVLRVGSSRSPAPCSRAWGLLRKLWEEVHAAEIDGARRGLALPGCLAAVSRVYAVLGWGMGQNGPTLGRLWAKSTDSLQEIWPADSYPCIQFHPTVATSNWGRPYRAVGQSTVSALRNMGVNLDSAHHLQCPGQALVSLPMKWG